jgi:hypothetical protein
MRKSTKIMMVCTLTLLLVMQGENALAKSKKKKGGPVTMIMNIEGKIEYSKNGKKWKKVKRNKFLFPGYKIRTGDNGNGSFLNQNTGMSRILSANSIIEITKEGAKAVEGALGEATKGSGDLIASLGNRFKKNQKYTTVRRGLKIKLGVASHSKRAPYKLSNAWPDLVWDNVIENPVVKKASKITDMNYNEFSYRVTIDDVATIIPAPKGSLVVRHTVKDLDVGKHSYKVELLKNGELASEKVKRASKFIWIDTVEENEILTRLNARNKDELLEAISLDNDGIKVGALDIYSNFFAANLDEIDMRPQMLEHIRTLKLGELLSNEGSLYQKLKEEDI